MWNFKTWNCSAIVVGKGVYCNFCNLACFDVQKLDVTSGTRINFWSFVILCNRWEYNVFLFGSIWLAGVSKHLVKNAEKMRKTISRLQQSFVLACFIFLQTGIISPPPGLPLSLTGLCRTLEQGTSLKTQPAWQLQPLGDMFSSIALLIHIHVNEFCT